MTLPHGPQHNPVEVGSFVDGGDYSDIALLGDDYVVATHLWDDGMVILRADSPAPGGRSEGIL